MKQSIILFLLLLAAVALMLTPDRAGAQTAGPAISPAETLLFETDHLARIKAPAVLTYAFRKVSNVEPGFSDQVQLDLASSNGKPSATLHFLSGAHRQDIPALENAHGNPVLLGFLERDISEMKRLTGGSTAYFRKRIRMALAEHAKIGTQTITYGGQTLPAQTVRIQPYLDDPMHARFEPYVQKTYTFIVSERVPGVVYQVRSSLANPAGRIVDARASAGPVPGAANANDRAAVSSGGAPAGAGMPSTPAPGEPRGAGKAAGPLPAIDETLTLVSSTHPSR